MQHPVCLWLVLFSGSLLSHAPGFASERVVQDGSNAHIVSVQAQGAKPSGGSAEEDPATIVVGAPDGPTLETRASIQRARDLGLASITLKLENVGLIQDDELMQLITAELYEILGASGYAEKDVTLIQCPGPCE